jgi:hypothetical protein
MRIEYGFPSLDLMEKAERGLVELGGCRVGEDDPTWACGARSDRRGST